MGDSSIDWNAVARDHRDNIYSVLLGYTGDPALANDLTQETLIMAMRGEHTFKPGSPMWPWLRTIAVRVCHRALETGRFHAEKEALAVERRVLAELNIDPVELLTNREGAFLWRLRPRFRRLLLLKHGMHLSLEEIAQLEGSTVAAVRSALDRARRALANARTAGPSALLPFVGRFRFRRRPLPVASVAYNPDSFVALILGVMLWASGTASFATLSRPATLSASRALPAARAQHAYSVERSPSHLLAHATTADASPRPKRIRLDGPSPTPPVNDPPYWVKRSGETTIHCDAPGITASTICAVLAVASPDPLITDPAPKR